MAIYWYGLLDHNGWWLLVQIHFLGQGDEHVYVHVCPGGVFILLDGPPPGEGREGAGLVVLGFRFLVMIEVCHTSRERGLHHVLTWLHPVYLFFCPGA